MSPQLSRLKGKINKWIGAAAGDRKQEAVGALQQDKGRDPEDSAEVDRAVKAVKEEHHDYGQRVPPQRVAHVDRAPAPRRVRRANRATSPGT